MVPVRRSHEPAEMTVEEDGASRALSVALSPRGHVLVHVPEGSELAPIAKPFERGDGHGVFRLGAADPETILPAALSFWRDVGRAFVVHLCATDDLEALRTKIQVEI